MSAALLLAAAVGFLPLAPSDAKPTWSIDIGAGPFDPQIAPSDSAGRDLYEVIFESGREDATFRNRPVLVLGTFSYYLFNEFGLFGLDAGIGHWSVDGFSRICEDATGAVIACSSVQAIESSKQGNSRQSLVVMPLSVGAVYRFDPLLRKFGIPLVPYAKAAVTYNLWWVRVEGQVAKSRDGKTRGEGGIWGVRGTAGLALNLDWLDPSASRNSQTGLLDTHLFIEATLNNANDFGDSRAPDFSDSFVSMGLTLDLR